LSIIRLITLIFFFNNRFGPSFTKDKGINKRRRSSTLNKDNESVPLELWDDETSLYELDFSQVFDQSNNDEVNTTADGGIPSDVSFLDRRGNYLIDLLARPDNCLVSGILQIWDFDLERIRSLDQNKILLDVNNALTNGSTNGGIESLELLLSDVRRDADNKVVYVGATTTIWLLDNNPSVCILFFYHRSTNGSLC